MKPYKNKGHLKGEQRNQNKVFSSSRVVIEHTFGIIKGRWRILHFVNVNGVKKAVKIITACCVVHNFCFIMEMNGKLIYLFTKKMIK